MTSCESCFYSRFALDATSGECRRHAPHAVVAPRPRDVANIFARWPRVQIDDCCGEWRNKAGGGRSRGAQPE